MKKTLTGLAAAIVFFVGGFTTIAVLTRVSDSLDQSGTAASQAIKERDEINIAQLNNEAENNQDAGCLNSELTADSVDCDGCTDAGGNQCQEQTVMLSSKLDAVYAAGSTSDFQDQKTEQNYAASYKVAGSGLELKSGDNAEFTTHNSVWKIFVTLVGDDVVNKNIAGFNIFNSDESIIAFTSNSEELPSKLDLSVNIAAATSDDKLDLQKLQYAFVHQLGHIVSQQADQGTIKNAQDGSCDTYRMDLFCADQDAYIQRFYTEFWDSVDLKAKDADKQIGTVYVSSRAAESVSEDFAESFATFVLTEKPSKKNTVSDKVLFFYSYPDLIEMRSNVHTSLQQ